MASVALRGFEQFEAALERAWDGGRPDAFTALGSARQGLSRIRSCGAGLLLGNVRGRRSGRRQSLRCGMPANVLSPSCAAPPTRSAPRCPRRAARLRSWLRCTSGPWRMASLRSSDAPMARSARCRCRRRNSWRRTCWSICVGSGSMRRGREIADYTPNRGRSPTSRDLTTMRL